MAINRELYFLTLLLIDFALRAFVFIITWRIARRFGWCGLAIAVIVAAVIGPPRDYWYMARFPGRGACQGSPVLAIAATYVVVVVLGHGVMSSVAGPARVSLLARRPWETAKPSARVDQLNF